MGELLSGYATGKEALCGESEVLAMWSLEEVREVEEGGCESSRASPGWMRISELLGSRESMMIREETRV